MKRLPASAAALGALMLLAGCFGGLKNQAPPPLMYRINAPKLAAGQQVAADLLVSVEATAPGLDGTGIVGRWPDARIDTLAGARWPVRAPALVEAALIEALQESGRLRSVQGNFSRFRTTHSLALELRRFEADYTGGEPPVAQVAVAVTIGRQSDRRVIAAFSVSAEEKATENRVGAVVAALDAAFGKVAAEVAGRGLETIERDVAAAQASANSGP